RAQTPRPQDHQTGARRRRGGDHRSDHAQRPGVRAVLSSQFSVLSSQFSAPTPLAARGRVPEKRVSPAYLLGQIALEEHPCWTVQGKSILGTRSSEISVITAYLLGKIAFGGRTSYLVNGEPHGT